MADTPARDSLIEGLKKSRPSSLRVVLLDGEVKEVSIPGKRKKWGQVRSILDKLSWIRLECLDAKKGVVDIVENDDPGEDMEELEGYAGHHQFLALMLKAQDVALRRDEERGREANKMILELSRVMMSRLVALEKAFAANLRMAQKFAASAAEGEEDGLMSDPLMEMLAPLLMQRMMGMKPPAVPDPPATPDPPSNNNPTES